jgi:hypothetical protein
MSFCIKAHHHDGKGGYEPKALVTDYEYQTRAEANADLRRVATEFIGADQRCYHQEGLSVVMDPSGDGYTTYNTSGDE